MGLLSAALLLVKTGMIIATLYFMGNSFFFYICLISFLLPLDKLISIDAMIYHTYNERLEAFLSLALNELHYSHRFVSSTNFVQLIFTRNQPA